VARVVPPETLFASVHKYDSHTGWPSFTVPVAPRNVVERADHSHGMVRVEVRSAEGTAISVTSSPTVPSTAGGLRYCINSAALRFVPVDDLDAEGYGAYLELFGPRE
jgi:peptide-methionine (R)-S-oxide reductase